MTIKPPLGAQLQFGHPLSQGLVGCWLMNEGSGSIVNDLSENGQTGTMTGAIWAAGKFGPCISFDGTDDGISCPSFVSSTAISVSLWIYPTANAISYWVAKYNLAATTGWILLQLTSGEVRWYTRGSGTDTYLSVASLYALNAWNHVVATYDGATRALYLNGRLKGSETNTEGLQNSTAYPVRMGLRDDSAADFTGLIDSVQIYNRALTATEVMQLYVEPFCMFRRRRIELWTGATLPAVTPTTGGIFTLNTGYWGGV